jgi:Group II intron, maturase-specific domain
VAKRMRAKLREIKEQLMAIRHEGTERQGRWLCQVLRGWMAYYAVPMSGSAISAFRHHMIERWHGALMRRSQRRRLRWTRMKKIADRHLPFPRILHPWPEKTVPRHYPRWEPGALAAPPGSVRGAERNLRPYRDLLHRHVSAMDMGAVKALTIRRSQSCKRSRQSVSILQSRFFRSTASTRRASWSSAVS